MARRGGENRSDVASGYEALTNALATRAADATDAQRSQLRTWAERRLPEVLAERQAIVRFLANAAAAVPDLSDTLQTAAQGYDEVGGLGQQLRERILALTAPTAAGAATDQTWPEAAALARQMQEAEERALQQVASLAR